MSVNAQQMKLFWENMAGQAVEANELEPRLNEAVILIQWAIESDYGTSSLCLTSHNYAGITTGDGKTFLTYATVGDFVKAYVKEMHLKYYTLVLQSDDFMAQAHALGASPWAGSHYEGNTGTEGGLIVEIYNEQREYIMAALKAAYDEKEGKKEKETGQGTQPVKQPQFWIQSGGYSSLENAQLVIDFCKAHGFWAAIYERI